ncbi:mechanosensitive ion channel family protein [Labilibaculum sp. DW002]|uniref:Mechanosensitive ion channel family protein n=1 Tax=Paralabilibaculum antarcticum TaxID=2912572 RepID=A0ABT5VNR2_9BACT|nr:mechanosensitive ion channel family protein [Labilibaculum sp. DW002]MDE5416895.1 mechanosensitive ion channel family protein [Labilibaculum sp. DW002]
MFESLIDFEALRSYFTLLVPKLATASLILLFTWLLWFSLSRVLQKIFKKTSFDLTLQKFLLTVSKITIMTIGIMTALGQVGINIASILASLGVVGLTIGFAARDTLSNIISGLFIFWDRPFVLNDLIEVKGMYGRVENITLRSTRIVTNEGKMLAVPNTTIINEVVASYTNFPHLRIEVEFTVGSNENLTKIRKILKNLVSSNDVYMQSPMCELLVDAINDYNLALIFRVWIDNERDHIRLRNQLIEDIYNTMLANKIEMPLETIQMAPFEVKVQK